MSGLPFASTSSSNSSSTSPTPQTTSDKRQVSTSPPRLARKSPPPPKLNLDDCKPVLPTTFASTSPNAASNSSTAFVFTSSRTLRTLHSHSRSVDDARPLSPLANIDPSYSPSYASSDNSTSPSADNRTQKRPLLSPTQLARHSLGAVDARCTVSPNMRAAGFVPLNHAPQYAPSTLSGPSTPSPVPTPADPPPFPPIVFVNPTNVSTTPMWDYQYTLNYALPSVNPGKSAPAAVRDRTEKNNSSGSGSGSIPDIASLGSSSSLFSLLPSSRSSTTSVSSGSQSSRIEKSLSRRMQGLALRDSSVDGFPFPETPPRSQAELNATIVPAPAPQIESRSSISSSTESGSVTPLASPSSPASPLPQISSDSGSGTPSSSSSGSQPPAMSRRTRKQNASRLSITELCSSSPNVWFGDPMQFAPPPVVKKETSRGSRTSHRHAGGRSKRSEAGKSTAADDNAAALDVKGPQVTKPVAEDMTRKPSTSKSVVDIVIQEEEEDEVAREKIGRAHV